MLNCVRPNAILSGLLVCATAVYPRLDSNQDRKLRRLVFYPVELRRHERRCGTTTPHAVASAFPTIVPANRPTRTPNSVQALS